MKKNSIMALCLLALTVGCHSPGGQRTAASIDRMLFQPTAWQTNVTSDATNIVPVAWRANPATVSTIQTVGSFIPGYGSLAGMAATAALGIVAHLRSRRFRAAAVSVIEGVNETMKLLPPEQHDALRTVHKEAQENAGTRSTVRSLLKT